MILLRENRLEHHDYHDYTMLSARIPEERAA